MSHESAGTGLDASQLDLALDPASVSADEPLTEREVEILAFEAQWWKVAGAKEHAIRELFDVSGVRYYQILNTLIDRPEAVAHAPILVARLRRTRQSRRRSGSARARLPVS